MTRIAFITDLHINLRGLAKGIDTEENFKNLLAKVSDWQPDHIVCGGDLSFKEPRIEDVQETKKNLELAGFPFSVIKGNHDNTRHLKQVFDYHVTSNEIYYEKRIGNKRCIFLDSNRGQMSTNQLGWLRSKLAQADKPLLFMHYPPTETGIAFMDKGHLFKTKGEFLRVIREYGNEIHLFCGHCHAERYIHLENLHVHITPSLMLQIDEREEELKIDHKHIAFRMIEIGQGDRLTTFVKYTF